jgi:hypothetical protein
MKYAVAFIMQFMSIASIFPVTAQNVLFDFDNATIHSPLPISLTVNGISAHFTATGQGFSIQQANVLGFTPPGFSGNVIYPSSVYAADLLISFDSTITDFSIMYSCQELGCDDAATMRATAYMNGILVGTNTKTAANPGTWPVDVLRGTFPQGFNSVVIHYDKRPPTCQDYGPIFMADNMRVTTYNPVTILLCPDIAGSTLLSDITGSVYQWQTAAGNVFTDITDNTNYTGTNTQSLQLNNIPSSWYGTKYRCVVDGNYSNPFILQFSDTWTGLSDTAWENPANWDCGKVPDVYTDVIVNAGALNYPTVNTNDSCRSLQVSPGAAVNVSPGFDLMISGK